MDRESELCTITYIQKTKRQYIEKKLIARFHSGKSGTLLERADFSAITLA